jgi:mono/diheme cytochrome c family protein
LRKALAAFLCLGLAACGPGRPAETSFDGAGVADAAALRAHGERLTHVLGCTSCHGARLEGAQFDPEMKQYGPIYASNLSLLVPHYSDEQIDAIVRRGAHPTRKAVWVMPSHIFQHLSDADLKALIAYMRSVPQTGKPTPPPQFSAEDRKEIAAGQYKAETRLVREAAAQLPADLGPRLALGRYIAQVTCAECHGPRLAGQAGGPPDLVAAGAYTRAEFDRLIAEGIPTGNRKLSPMMSGVARVRFSHLTGHERDALYAYLKARAEQAR